jgi:hypothetical protein
MLMPKINPAENQRHLIMRYQFKTGSLSRPWKFVAFELLVPGAESVSIPIENSYLLLYASAEYEYIT